MTSAHLPTRREDEPQLVARLIEQLAQMPGVEAVALGGSRAAGTHHAASDWDFGVYQRCGKRPVETGHSVQSSRSATRLPRMPRMPHTVERQPASVWSPSPPPSMPMPALATAGLWVTSDKNLLTTGGMGDIDRLVGGLPAEPTSDQLQTLVRSVTDLGRRALADAGGR
jgi:hypothetical protein